MILYCGKRLKIILIIVFLFIFQTYVELDNTQKRKNKTEAKSNDAVEKATTERNHIKRELDVVKDSLDKIKYVQL